MSAFYPMGTGRAVSSGVKRQGREADHSSKTSAEIKNGGAIPPFSSYLHNIMLNYTV
jgi:hypothetical protein